MTHLLDAQFRFEPFRNWHSELHATGVLVVLSIFLRLAPAGLQAGGGQRGQNRRLSASVWLLAELCASASL